MQRFEQALELILRVVKPLDAEVVELLDAVGRTAALDFAAPRALPLFANSAMDGFAVRLEDCRPGALLRVKGFVPAGAGICPKLEPGAAIRIMTGAPVPQDADAVVPLEETEAGGDGEIRVMGEVQSGQHIRCAGEDVNLGDTLIPAGTLIGVAEVNLLAALGVPFLSVHRKPVVSILATGDELVPLGGMLASGNIYDSNSIALAAAAREAGAIPVMLGIARDNVDSLQQKIVAGMQADVIITAAGVSVGDRDLVREVLAQLGAKELFWGVKMKPGKATAFSLLAGKPVFSVPGNPVSAMITFEQMLRPALLRMSGRRAVVRALAKATLQDSLRKKPGRVFFARVALELKDGKLLAWSAGPQDTGFQRTMLRADGIAVLPPEGTSFRAGDEIKVQVLSSNVGMLEPEAALDAIAEAMAAPQPEPVSIG
jgi:molybdopterin molybdotransferase